MSKRKTNKRHLTDLDYPTDNRVKKSYIKKRSLLCKRKDIGNKELKDMSFNSVDMDKVIYVFRQKPKKSPSLLK